MNGIFAIDLFSRCETQGFLKLVDWWHEKNKEDDGTKEAYDDDDDDDDDGKIFLHRSLDLISAVMYEHVS